MNHPEIPPNCKFFEKTYTLDSDCDACANALTYDKHGECIASETWCFTTCCETVCIFGEYQYVCIEHIDRDTRPLIAAVARCAWLDEVDRLDVPLIQAPHYASFKHLKDSGKNMSHPDYAEAYEALKAWVWNKRVATEKARANAWAWKLWGEAK